MADEGTELQPPADAVEDKDAHNDSAFDDDENNDEHVEVSPDGRWKKINEKVEISHQLLPKENTWHAFDTEKGLRVVWTEIEFSARKDESHRKKLKRRFDLLKKIRHENIVRFFDYWIEKSRVVYITELMTAGTLRQYMRKEGAPKRPYNRRVISRWCTQILSALRYIHACHKDHNYHGKLRSSTIFIQHNGQIKIGLVSLDDIQSNVNTLRQPIAQNSLIDKEGLVYYSPEMACGSSGKNKADDIYAFGIVCLEMCRVSRPFGEFETDMEIFNAKKEGTLPKCWDEVEDKGFKDFIKCCLVPESERATAEQLFFHRYLFRVPSLRVFAAHKVLALENKAASSGDEDALDNWKEQISNQFEAWAESTAKDGFVQVRKSNDESWTDVPQDEENPWPSNPQKVLEDVRHGFFPLAVVHGHKPKGISLKQKARPTVSTESPEERRLVRHSIMVAITYRDSPPSCNAKQPQTGHFEVRYKLQPLVESDQRPPSSLAKSADPNAASSEDKLPSHPQDMAAAQHLGTDASASRASTSSTVGPEPSSAAQDSAANGQSGKTAAATAIEGTSSDVPLSTMPRNQEDSAVRFAEPLTRSVSTQGPPKRQPSKTDRMVLSRTLTFDLDIDQSVSKHASELMVKHGLLHPADQQPMTSAISQKVHDMGLLRKPKSGKGEGRLNKHSKAGGSGAKGRRATDIGAAATNAEQAIPEGSHTMHRQSSDPQLGLGLQPNQASQGLPPGPALGPNHPVAAAQHAVNVASGAVPPRPRAHLSLQAPPPYMSPTHPAGMVHPQARQHHTASGVLAMPTIPQGQIHPQQMMPPSSHAYIPSQSMPGF